MAFVSHSALRCRTVQDLSSLAVGGMVRRVATGSRTVDGGTAGPEIHDSAPTCSKCNAIGNRIGWHSLIMMCASIRALEVGLMDVL